MSLRKGSQRGLTLVEVLVALVVLAVTATAVLRTAGQQIAQQEQLAFRSLALWVAENQMALVYAADTWLPTGSQSTLVENQGLNWQIKTEISETANPDVRRVEVSVAVETGEQFTLTGFQGRH